MKEYTINEELKILFKLFNKLTNEEEFKINVEQKLYLTELIKKEFRILKELKGGIKK